MTELRLSEQRKNELKKIERRRTQQASESHRDLTKWNGGAVSAATRRRRSHSVSRCAIRCETIHESRRDLPA